MPNDAANKPSAPSASESEGGKKEKGAEKAPADSKKTQPDDADAGGGDDPRKPEQQEAGKGQQPEGDGGQDQRQPADGQGQTETTKEAPPPPPPPPPREPSPPPRQPWRPWWWPYNWPGDDQPLPPVRPYTSPDEGKKPDPPDPGPPSPDPRGGGASTGVRGAPIDDGPRGDDDIVRRVREAQTDVRAGVTVAESRTKDCDEIVRWLKGGPAPSWINDAQTTGTDPCQYYIRQAKTLISGLASGSEKDWDSRIVRNKRITAVYAALYLANPKQFKWAGLAAIASSVVGKAMRDTQGLAADLATPILAVAGLATPGEIMDALAEGNRLVYEDIGWQHLAFMTGGIRTIAWCYHLGYVKKNQLLGWALICYGTSRSVAEGSGLLLAEEQRMLQTLVYDTYADLGTTVTSDFAAALAAIVGVDASMHSHLRPYMDFSGENFGDYDRRMEFLYWELFYFLELEVTDEGSAYSSMEYRQLILLDRMASLMKANMDPKNMDPVDPEPSRPSVFIGK